MPATKADDLTIDRWRIEPRPQPFDPDDLIQDLAPPLWKDLTVAAVAAGLLWVAAVALLT
jgi:hypothetical protein